MQKNNLYPASPLLRTALYVRVSSEEQVQHGLSLEAQESALNKWAKENECEIVGTYIDGGKTARKALSRRVELQRLLEDVRADKIDLIIFTKFDRWTRNIKDYYKLQETLDAHRVNWKAIFENYDTSTANGRLHINIMLSISQDEADRTSERIKAVFAMKHAKGEGTHPNLPIGYKLVNRKIVVDEERKQIVLDLFNSYHTYNSQYRAANDVAALHNVHLHNYTVKSMLTNPIYIGTYRDTPNFCEPLVDVELFNEVQSIIKSRNVKQTPSKYDFIFTSLLTCQECGHKMAGNAALRTFSGGRKDYYASYRCNNYVSNRTCTHNRCMGEKKLEEYLLNNINEKLQDYITTCEAEQLKPRKKPKVNKADILRKMDKLKNLYMNDLIDIEIYKKDYEELTEKLRMANTEPKEDKRDLSPLYEFLNSDFQTIYSDLTNIEKRTLWRKIIKRLIIGADNKITIEFTN